MFRLGLLIVLSKESLFLCPFIAIVHSKVYSEEVKVLHINWSQNDIPPSSPSKNYIFPSRPKMLIFTHRTSFCLHFCDFCIYSTLSTYISIYLFSVPFSFTFILSFSSFFSYFFSNDISPYPFNTFVHFCWFRHISRSHRAYVSGKGRVNSIFYKDYYIGFCRLLYCNKYTSVSPLAYDKWSRSRAKNHFLLSPNTLISFNISGKDKFLRDCWGWRGDGGHHRTLPLDGKLCCQPMRKVTQDLLHLLCNSRWGASLWNC